MRRLLRKLLCRHRQRSFDKFLRSLGIPATEYQVHTYADRYQPKKDS